MRLHGMYYVQSLAIRAVKINFLLMRKKNLEMALMY